MRILSFLGWETLYIIPLEKDLDLLKEYAESLLRDIQDDIAGTKIERNTLFAEFERGLSKSRFVQIGGLPGIGKSVLLRNSVERSILNGSVLFLKGDQLEGNNWRTFANNLGLSHAPLEDLLVEIAATGTPILYLDAIDRVEKNHQLIR